MATGVAESQEENGLFEMCSPFNEESCSEVDGSERLVS